MGGHVVVDFVNTVPWRLDPARTTDDLTTPAALAGWLRRTGLWHRNLGADDQVLEEVRRLRENCYAVLIASIEGSQPPPDRAGALREAMVTALSHARTPTLVPLRWEFEPAEAADLPALLALEIWRFLQFTDLTRLRRCADDGCGWLFLDASRNGSRRWCSSADCGNRARVRRHYRRSRS